MKTRRFLFGSVVLPLTGMIVFSGSARAADAIWHGLVDATWAGANWNPVTIPGTGNTATFNGAGNSNTMINLGGGVTIGNILFDTASAAAYTIGSGAVGSQTLTLNDSGAITVKSTVTNNELFDAAIVLGADSSAQSYTFTNNSANTLTFAGNISGGAGGTGGTKTLTLGGAGNIVFSGNLNRDIGTANSNLAITKIGTDTLTVNATINSGSASGAIKVNAGKLAIDFTNAGANNNLLSSFSPVTIGGGTLQIIGNGANASSQTFAQGGGSGLTSNGGYNVVTVGANSPTLTLNGFTQNIGSQTVFYGPAHNNNASNAAVNTVAATGTITTTYIGTGNNNQTAGAGTKGLLWNGTTRQGISTVGLYDWASTNTAAGANGTSPYTIIGGSQVSGFYNTVAAGGTATAADQNFDLLGNATANNATIWFADTLRFNVPGAFSFTTQAGGAGRAALIGGILVTPNVGTNNTTINTGGAWLGAINNNNSTNSALTVYQNNTVGQLLINAPLYFLSSNTRAMSYVQGGAGTVVLTGSGTSSGNTGAPYLNGGFTVISNNTQIGATATKATANLNGGTIVAAATMGLNGGAGVNVRPVALLGNGGGLAAYSGATLTVDGVVSGGAGNGPLFIGIPASSANGNVAGQLPGTGAGTANTTAVNATGTVVLTGVNGYFGGTTVQGGSTLNVNGINALGGTNYGGLILNSGTLQYATGFSNGSGDLTSIGTAGVTLASGGGTIDTNGNTVAYAGSIGNSGSGALTINDTGVTTGSLTLGGVNTYTGGTTLNSGALALSTNGTLGATTGALSVNNPNTAAGTDVVLNLATAADTTVGSLSGAIATPSSGTNTATINTQTGQNFTVNQTSAGTYGGVIGGGGSFTLGNLSSSTLTLSSGNTYTGGTTIASGTLKVTNAISTSATGTGGVALNGGTLTGNGFISGTVTQGGGIIAPGALGTTLTLGGLTYNSGTLGFSVDGAGSGTSSVIATTNAAFTGAPTVSLSLTNVASFTNGQSIPLLTSTNAITGGGFLTGLTPTVIGRITLTPEKSGNNTIVLKVTGSAGNMIWAGGVGPSGSISGDNSTWNNLQTPAVAGNWNKGGTRDYFYDQDNVTFDNTASSQSVNLTTNLSPGSVTVNSGTYTFGTSNGSGIVGACGLTVAGGSLNLNTANSYSGGTTIGAGATLKTGKVGALPGTGTVTVAGTLNLGGFNQTIGTLSDGAVSTGIITNSGVALPATLAVNGITGTSTFSGVIQNGASTTALSKAGASMQTLSGSNTYSGGTTLTAGTLNLNKGTSGNSTSSAIGTGAFAINGGTIDTTVSGINLGTNNAITVGASFTYGGTNNLNLGSGAVTITGSRTITLGGTFSTLTMGGVATNTTNASITTTVDGTDNTLVLGSLNLNSGAGPVTDTFDGSGNVSITGIVANGGAGPNGLTYAGTGTLTLNGANTYNGATAVSAGTLNLAGSGSFTGSNVSTSGIGSFTEDSGASIGGSGVTFTQGSSGTSTLDGVNTYTGATSVSAGTLSLTGSLSGSSVNTSGSGIVSQASGSGIGGSGVTFTQGSSGTSVLAGTNTYTGTTTVFTGVLTLAGSLGSSGTPSGAIGVNGGTLNLIGTEFYAPSLSTYNGGSVVNLSGGGIVVLSGNLGVNDSNGSTNGLVSLINGSLSANSVTIGRTGGSYGNNIQLVGNTGSGLYVNGAAVNINTTLGIGAAAGNFSSADMRVDNGSVTVGGTTTITTNNNRYSLLDINGGIFTSNDTTGAGIQVGGLYPFGYGELLIRGAGTVNTHKITLGDTNQTAGLNTLEVIGGTTYIGSGGIVAGGGVGTNTINLGNATVATAPVIAASADWSSLLNMTLAKSSVGSGSVSPVFQTADSSTVGHDIALSGILSGTGGLTKTGTGKLTLSGSNSYTGTTSVSQGILQVNGNSAAATGAVSVDAGATLKGDGTLGGAVTANGFVAPGSSIGTLAVAAATFNTGSELDVEINDASIPMTDKLTVAGALDITNGKLKLTTTGGLAQPVYVIAHYGTLTGIQFATVENLPSGATINYAYNDGVDSNNIAIVNPTSSYAAWTVAKGLTAGVNDGATQDPDKDGLTNLLEFVLGGNPLASSAGILPSVTTNPTNFVFTFSRSDESEAEAALTFQYGSNLTGWTDVAIGAADALPVVAVAENLTSPDTITVTIPRGANTKLFGRLKAVKTP